MKSVIWLLFKEIVTSSLFFSYSERLASVPNWEEYPTDYEWRFGGKTRSFETIWLWEREVGHYGYGRENRYVFEIKDVNYKNINLGAFKLGGSDFVRSVLNINYQEQYLIFETGIPKYGFSVGCGTSYLWENNFRNPTVCLKTTLEFHKIIDIKFSQETDLISKCNRNLYIGKSFLYKVPGLRILDFRFIIFTRRFWSSDKLKALQNKVEVQFEFDLKQLKKKFMKK